MKTKIDIEKLLRWAYRDELPKREVEAAGSGLLADLMMLGAPIDVGHDGCGFAVDLGPPHPDALVVDHAVRSLDSVAVVWSESRALLHSIDGLIDETDVRIAKLRIDLRGLVAMHARMGNRPVWDLGELVCERITNVKNGKPVVQFLDGNTLVEGRLKTRHYGPGARCPLRWVPDPAEVVCARAEYAAWRAGLVELTRVLRGWSLREWDVLPPSAAPAPWITGPEHQSRVLPDKRPAPAAIARPRRERAATVASRRASAVRIIPLTTVGDGG